MVTIEVSGLFYVKKNEEVANVINEYSKKRLFILPWAFEDVYRLWVVSRRSTRPSVFPSADPTTFTAFLTRLKPHIEAVTKEAVGFLRIEEERLVHIRLEVYYIPYDVMLRACDKIMHSISRLSAMGAINTEEHVEGLKVIALGHFVEVDNALKFISEGLQLYNTVVELEKQSEEKRKERLFRWYLRRVGEW